MYDQNDHEAALAAQPETSRKVEAFLTNPQDGLLRESPRWRLPADGYIYPDETTQACATGRPPPGPPPAVPLQPGTPPAPGEAK